MNYWVEWICDDDGSWFGQRATEDRLRRTNLSRATAKNHVMAPTFVGACVSSSVRRHVSSTGM